MTTVTRIYSFEAAHKLPDEFGAPANRVHGHTYTVRVETVGGYATERLDEHWASLLAPLLDHRLLNEVVHDTTVEGLAEWMLTELARSGAPVLAVEVQEGRLRFGRAVVEEYLPRGLNA